MSKKLSIAERYIKDVLAGRIITSIWVKQQIERHVRDLAEGESRGLVFDREAAQHVIDFFPQFLTFDAGRLDGKPFVLEPFQQARLWISHGWKWKATGFRRFKYAYNEIARGNCKSTEVSGLSLYHFLASGEAGAQIYSGATDLETAKLVFNTSRLMLDRSPYLSEQVTCTSDLMHIPGTAAFFRPVASDAKFLMGLRPSFISMDELHMQTNDGVWNVFTSAMGKRDEPLLWVSTNSGFNRQSVCWRKRDYSLKVLSGAVKDDTWFAWICGLDPGDDWEDEKNWIKANPGLGVMVQLSELREQATQAKNDPSALNSFLRFRMSVWTSSDVAWMPSHLWDRCNGPVDSDVLRGRRCIGALDLSTTTDTSSFVLTFPPTGDDPKWRILPRFFLPAAAVDDRVKRDQVPYDVWERQGLFTLTAGRTIDYDVIREQVHEDSERFDIVEIVYDRWNANDLVRRLEDDRFTMVKWGQGMLDMNAPTKRLYDLVLEEQLAHGGNEVLAWQVNNVIVHVDAGGNVKPDKGKSRDKIDGAVAMIMGIGRGMQLGEEQYTRPRVRVC